MSGGTQEYKAAEMTQLFNDLNSSHGNLLTYGNDIHDAKGILQSAWEDNKAHEDFMVVAKQWDDEYQHTLEVLQRVAGAVESALHRALGTDGKIGDGFAGL
ncbi:hypothetical protein [Nocardia veterana]|uniref:WXG100 family type VII secretion target n=1 Tax=Nocardia veterana TaxID=132249 RepID=A0A7X6M216_9NOCA|nr:hypothetical protein [Nocardia veterana]NKY88785.1 hypothetical protein [Nocardia veterana]